MNTDRRKSARIPQELPEELISRVAEKSFAASQILANESIGALTNDLPVERFMTCDLTNARPTDTAAAIRAQMKEHGFRHMLVCEVDASGVERLRGVVSDRDVANLEEEPAAEFMAAKPVTVHPESGMMHAAAAMLNRRISCVPVVDSDEQDRVLGILTLTDMLLGLNCLLPVMEGIAEQLAALETHDVEERVATAVDQSAELVRQLRGN